MGLSLLAAPAFAASISGSVQDENSAGLQGIQVQLWRTNAKQAWEVVSTTTTAAAGAYNFTGLSGGLYRVSARVPSSISDTDSRARRMDKFYDVATPTNDGFTLSAADILDLNATPNESSIIIPMAKGWGMDGDVAFGSTTYSGITLRAELRTDFEQHHETTSRNTLGEPGATIRGDWHFRGLEFSSAGNAAEHRIITYDPLGRYEPELSIGPATTPYGGSANAVADVGRISMGSFATNADPNEPNDLASVSQYTQVDETVIRGGAAWTTSGAIITPNDVDWYCWDALPTERYVITTSTARWLNGSGACCTDQLDGETRYSPWVDPMIRLVRNFGANEQEDDDSAAAGPLDAMIDTGEISASPSYCVIVTTFGDSNFNGAGQGTFGRYQLEIVMGNRRPTSTITDTNGTINDGDTRVIDEGEQIILDIATSDPDGDTPAVTVDLVDGSGNPAGGSYNSGTGQWNWTPGQGDAGSYTITVTVCDAELCTVTVINLNVNGVNVIPETPAQVDPTDGSSVANATPTLVVDNAYDPDPDVITYDFQLYYFTNPGPSPTVAPDQEVTGLAEGTVGNQTSWVPAGIPENTTVYWRVRAWDGVDASSYSNWSGYFSFIVNVINDPPIPPVLTKPTEGEIVTTRTPTLEVNNTTDPEGDDILLYYQIATDDTFGTIIETSAAVPQSTAGSFTTWVATTPLDWGTSYAARAYAEDINGATQGFSNTNHFRLQENGVPSDINLEAPFAPASCQDVVLAVIPTSITVSNAVDPENEPLTLDLEIYDFAATPGVDTPVISVQDFPQDTAGNSTVIPIDETQLAEDAHYLVRAQASDGLAFTSWAECDMWINTSNSAPGPITIIAPEPGTLFPSDTQAVTVTVQNADDAEAGMPGSTLSIVLCASADSAFSDCDASPANWQLEPSTADPSANTDIVVSQLTDGTLLGPDMSVYVQACALDDMDECGPLDSTDFLIDAVVTDPCANVQCTAPEVCDPATGTCVDNSTTDGGVTDGGDTTTDGGGGGGGEGSGCCGGDTAHGGRTGLAFAAIFGLLALWTTRRRR